MGRGPTGTRKSTAGLKISAASAKPLQTQKVAWKNKALPSILCAWSLMGKIVVSTTCVLASLLLLNFVRLAPAGAAQPLLYTYRIVKAYPHDPTSFTQGLLYYGNDTLYESSGMYGESNVRQVDLLSGKVVRQHKEAGTVFGEGLALFKDRLLQVTWKTRDVNVFNRSTLKLVARHKHPMQDGWGLTNDAKQLIGSDGSSSIYFINPSSFALTRRVVVRDGGREVRNLNELEYINGFVWANIWLTDCIVKINPADGRVHSWILMQGLRTSVVQQAQQENAAYASKIDVLNGIAWDSKKKRLFVTGKYWPKLFHISSQKLEVTAAKLESVRRQCLF